MNIILSNLGFVCALGNSKEEIIQNAISKNSGIIKTKDDIPNQNIPFGFVKTNDTKPMRCYTLLDMAFSQIKDDIENLKKSYALSRIGIVLGSSNTGIHEAQKHIEQWIKTNNCPADFSFDEIELGSPAVYLQKITGTKGPAYTVSTACSSSAKVFRSARDLIKNDICDIVIVGGVDSHCAFTQNGFFALESISTEQTNPMSKNRSGINLGEGCALFIMQKSEKANGVKLLGIGESSDAYHLTHPEPNGNGAELAMTLALKDANLTSDKIDYINMHGTGTIANDSMESFAISRVFTNSVLCASTKPLTGHALGASGAIEAGLSYLMLKNQVIIPHIYDGNYDDTLPKLNLANGNEAKHLSIILSNSFAFGGSNASLILGL